LDVDDDSVMNEMLDKCGGNDGIAEVVAEFLKIDARGHECRSSAASPIDDLEEECGMPSLLLLDKIEIDDFGLEVL